MPVLVKNKKKGPTTFSDLTSNVAIEWQGAGHPHGEDHQYVPDEIAVHNVHFLKAVQRGIFEVVESSPEAKEKIAAQVSAYEQRQKVAHEEILATIDPSTDRAISSVSIDEKGAVTPFEGHTPTPPAEAAVPSFVIGQTEDADGNPKEAPIPVIITEREREGG